MNWIRSRSWDLFWVWNGVPIGLVIVLLTWKAETNPILGFLGPRLVHESVFYRVPSIIAASFAVGGGSTGLLCSMAALGIVLETGHLISSAVAAWSDADFRPLLVQRRTEYIVLPIAIFLACLTVGVLTASGLTSYQPGPRAIYHITDWRNPLPVMVWLFWLSVGWHFSMQNFGLVRMYRRRVGSPGWRRADLCVCLLVTTFFMNVLPIVASPETLGLPFPRLVAVPWWVFPFAVGLLAWNHWIVALGLGSAMCRRVWVFITIVGLFGLVGFFWKFPTANQIVIFTAPVVFSAVIGLHSVHYIYDRGIFRLSDKHVRETLGRRLYLRPSAVAIN